jgi:hypothetical protein
MLLSATSGFTQALEIGGISSMRFYALCATANGMGASIVDAIPNCAYIPAGQDGRLRRLVFTRDDLEIHVLLFSVTRDYDLGPASAAPSGKWDIWVMVADDMGHPQGKKWLARALRHLRKHGEADEVFGPFSFAELLDRWPDRAAALLMKDGEWSFPHLMGDRLGECAKVDYRPTADDIQNDIDDEPGV